MFEMNRVLKPLHWVATALDDLRECPEEVQDAVGYALHIDLVKRRLLRAAAHYEQTYEKKNHES